MDKIIVDIETSGLEPVQNNDRVTFISTIVEENGSEKILDFYDEDEKKMLTSFWDYLDSNVSVITFNGDNFDLPFLVKRSIIHKIPIVNFSSVDIRKILNMYTLNQNTFVKGTLNDWAKCIGMEVKSEDGLECVKAFEERNWDLIKKHCDYDAKITLELYKRLEGCILR